MAAGAETLRGLLQSVDNIGVSDGREVLRNIVTRRAVAAERADDDDQIADLDMLLERAAAADADKGLCAGAA
jgi:hypothetical protein